ncbi:MAG: DegV family protein [Bacillota bacterium]|nr:DegV family protein [Bacillota bacterium]
MGVKLVTDSSCDFPLSFLEENKDIFHILPCYIDLGGKTLIDDFGVSYDLKQFYVDIRAGIKPRTSMVTPNRFAALYTEFIEAGHEIVYCGFSSALGGVHNSSTLAAMQVKAEYPDAKIYIVDTLSASIGLSICCMEAVKMVRAGKSGAEVAEHLDRIKMHVNHWFGVDGLKFLKDGGRISPMVAMIGTTLNIKPTLTIDRLGRIVPAGKVRGRRKSIETLSDKVVQRYDPDFGSVIGIGHADCETDALELERILRTKFPEAEFMLVNLHITIATHVGPGMLAVAFYGKEREE